MPKICQGYRHQCQDILMHILYNDSSEPVLCRLIVQSMNNISEANGKHPMIVEQLKKFKPTPSTPVALLRATFFLLLNMDHRMRTELCTRTFEDYLPRLCQHKACVFYVLLRQEVITWMKNERISPLELVEKVKDTYLLS